MREEDKDSAEEMFSGQLDEAKSLAFLARAIVEHRAIVFVGAGASASANDELEPNEAKRPTWSTLINGLGKKAEAFLGCDDKDGRDYLKQLITEKRYLEAADVIQDLLNNDLDLELWDSFDGYTKPSDIHVGIARIPFSLAITTNYDRLLEAAYNSEKTVLTWQNPEAVLQALQFRLSVILKTHGAIGNGPSIVLAGRRYRDLMYANPRFQQLLKWIFLTRTCLFVGSSLTDPDLAHLFHEAISEYPATFGPHYAILPRSEASKPRIRNLFSSLRIRVLIAEDQLTDQEQEERKDKKEKKEGTEKGMAVPGVDVKEEHDAEAATKGQETTGKTASPGGVAPAKASLGAGRPASNKISREVTRKLTVLSGEVARQTAFNAPPSLPSSDDKAFYLNLALKKLLREAVRLTGSFRGDICLLHDRTMETRMSDYLEYAISEGPTDIQVQRHLRVAANSVCGIAYYKASSEYGVYISDVEARSVYDKCQLKHYGEINYLAGHTEVRSELALPIDADGVRMGVLNLESRLTHAYTEGHFEAARWFTDKCGRMFATVNERRRRGRVLDKERIRAQEGNLRDLLRKLWIFCRGDEDPQRKIKLEEESRSLAFVVYQANYFEGELSGEVLFRDEHGNFLKGERGELLGRALIFQFEDPSLASRVFRCRKPMLFDDAKAAMKENQISDKYASGEDEEHFGLSGSILGFPVYIRGHIAGVVVIWQKDGTIGRMRWADLELFWKTAHLLANARRTEIVENEKRAQSGKQITTVVERDRIDLAPVFTLAHGILQSFERHEGPEKPILVKEPEVPSFGKYWRDRLGSEVLKLLTSMQTAETTRNYTALPVPRRARLWVLMPKEPHDEVQTFGLAFEVVAPIKPVRSMEPAPVKMPPSHGQYKGAKNPDDDLFRYEFPIPPILRDARTKRQEASDETTTPEPGVDPGLEGVIVTQPERIAQPNQQSFRKSSETLQTGKIDCNDSLHWLEEKIKAGKHIIAKHQVPNAYLFPNNSYLSFLLSRWNADRFTRVQYPNIFGPDPKREWLGQGEHQPWYVAPILIDKYAEKESDTTENKECEPESDKNGDCEKSREPKRVCVGYLTLDEGDLRGQMTTDTKDGHSQQKEGLGKFANLKGDEHQILQNEMMHLIDFFVACLAASRKFDHLRTDESNAPR